MNEDARSHQVDAGLLTSWESIAAHLDVSIQTAQRWEAECSLPVRRLPGAGESVQASTAELDAWKERARARRLLIRRRAAQAAVLCLFVAVVFAWVPRLGNAQPATLRVFSNGFAVMDRAGVALWHKTFPSELDLTVHNTQPRHWAVEDLTGDGSREVLFLFHPPKGNSVLHCYSSTGEELWSWQQDRTLRSSMASYAPPYRMTMLIVDKGARGARVLVVAQHHLYFPTRVAVFSPDGKLTGDYLHSGHLGDVAFHDLDGDGAKELLLAGVTNAHASATIVVLDPEAMTGSSDESGNPKYQLLAPLAREKNRLLLPHSKLGKASSPFNFAVKLDVSGRSISAHVREIIPEGPDVIWEYSPDLRPIQVAGSPRFVRECSQMSGRSAADCAAELIQMRDSVRDLTKE